MASTRSGNKRYSAKAQDKISDVMHEFKRGKLKSGSGQTVTNPKQAIAISISVAREEGGKVPKAPAEKKTSDNKTSDNKAPLCQRRVRQLLLAI